jgi:hypothetical protein
VQRRTNFYFDPTVEGTKEPSTLSITAVITHHRIAALCLRIDATATCRLFDIPKREPGTPHPHISAK